MRPTNRDTPPAGHFNATAVADRRDSRAGRPQLARPDLADSKPPQQHHLPPDRTLRSAPRCWLSQHRRPPSNRSLAPQRPGRVTKRRRDAPQRPRVTAHSFAVPFSSPPRAITCIHGRFGGYVPVSKTGMGHWSIGVRIPPLGFICNGSRHTSHLSRDTGLVVGSSAGTYGPAGSSQRTSARVSSRTPLSS